MTKEQLEQMSIKELTALYNEHAVNKISKFKDKPTAVARVLKITDFEVGVIIIQPNHYIMPCKEGTKVAIIIDAMWTGATELEILNILGETKKTKANTAKFNHWLRWNVNKDKGYGIVKKLEGSIEKYFIITKGEAKPDHKKKKGD